MLFQHQLLLLLTTFVACSSGEHTRKRKEIKQPKERKRSSGASHVHVGSGRQRFQSRDARRHRQSQVELAIAPLLHLSKRTYPVT